MKSIFKPRMDILPPAQQRLWPELRHAAELGFALYGGTAIALRLGHRASVDFDFFSEKPLDREAIRAAFPFITQSPVLKSLVYFDDGDLHTLTKSERTCLIQAVSQVRDLPQVQILSQQLTSLRSA
jgi:hypothetical protein